MRAYKRGQRKGMGEWVVYMYVWGRGGREGGGTFSTAMTQAARMKLTPSCMSPIPAALAISSSVTTGVFISRTCTDKTGRRIGTVQRADD